MWLFIPAGFKLIHISKRGVWQATYCNMLVADVLMSRQKRTSIIRIHFADITGVLVSHVCYYRFGLSRTKMKLYNIFTMKCSLLSQCVPLKSSQPAMPWGVRELPIWRSYSPMWAMPSVGSWKMNPNGGRILSLWLLPVMHAASTRFLSIRTHYFIQIQKLHYSNLAQTHMGFNSLKTHHWIIISSISHENIFAPLYNYIIGVTVPIRFYDMNYMGFKVEQY